MFFKKEKKCTHQQMILSAVMKALGLYFAVLGVRLQLSSYKIFVLDAMLIYLVAVLLFGIGKHMHHCCAK